MLIDVDEAPLKELAAELSEDDVMTAVADVRDVSAMQQAAAAAVERFGGVDIVLANAGLRELPLRAAGGSRCIQAGHRRQCGRCLQHRTSNAADGYRPAGLRAVVSSLAAYAASPGMASYGASKAGAEQFANALRLELAPLGVDVGSAHMSWIQTPMIADAKDDLSTFTDLFATFPAPLSKVTSVDKCSEIFVKGIEGRKRRVNCPRWVGSSRRLRPLLSSTFGEAQMLKSTPDGLLARIRTLRSPHLAALGERTERGAGQVTASAASPSHHRRCGVGFDRSARRFANRPYHR